ADPVQGVHHCLWRGRHALAGFRPGLGGRSRRPLLPARGADCLGRAEAGSQPAPLDRMDRLGAGGGRAAADRLADVAALMRMVSAMARISVRVTLGLLCVGLVACSSPPRPQIEDRSSRRPETVITRVPDYAVVRGDTMYGIAFRLGIDYRDLARWNDIHPPYTIHPGQRLKVLPPPGDSRPAIETGNGVAVTAPLPDRP